MKGISLPNGKTVTSSVYGDFIGDINDTKSTLKKKRILCK